MPSSPRPFHASIGISLAPLLLPTSFSSKPSQLPLLSPHHDTIIWVSISSKESFFSVRSFSNFFPYHVFISSFICLICDISSVFSVRLFDNQNVLSVSFLSLQIFVKLVICFTLSDGFLPTSFLLASSTWLLLVLLR